MMKIEIRTLSVLAVLAVLVVLAGCKTFSHSCSAPEYGTAGTLPPLKAPEGLDAPDTRNALQIPQLAEAPPRADSKSCLEEPPAYKPGAVLDGKPSKKSKKPKQPAPEKSL